MRDFQCSFEKEDVSITFREQQKGSAHTVCIGGRQYTLEGDSEKIEWLKEHLSLSPESSISMDQLHDRIQKSGDLKLIFSKVSSVGSAVLSESLEAQRVKMEEFLSEAVEKQHFQGAVLVVKDGRTILHGGYGLLDVGEEKNNPSTRFCIGSMGKMLTASAISSLVQQGKLSLDNKILDHLPPQFHSPLFSEITVRHLLSHSAGLPMYGSMPTDDERTKGFSPDDLY
jgi:hypothetical protein